MAALLRRASFSSVFSERPPSYTSTDPAPFNEPPPPFTAFPSRYSVKGRDVSFVEVRELKQHLKLLAAFHRLQKAVEAIPADGKHWAAGLEPKARWACFLAVAVRRYEIYLDKPVLSWKAEEFAAVPLDVALVNHAYQLNPSAFEEDYIRTYPQLSMLKDLVLTTVADTINQETLEQHAKKKDEKQWFSITETLFDPLANFAATRGRPVVDIKTGALFPVPWLTEDGKGYAQAGFEAVAPSGKLITHEVLGLYKLCKDVRAVEGSSIKSMAGTVSCLMTQPANRHAQRRADFVCQKLKAALPTTATTSAFDLGEKLNVANIMACYTRGEPFSLDLAMAVIRQCAFIEQMHSLGWLAPSRFAEDETILKRCVARYHAFMDLLSSTPSMFCVPTLDIDLAWHTHQLTSRYRSDTLSYIGRLVDHDDKVEENALSTAFDVTARAWQSRFGVPYSTCGCPLPSQPPLSRLATKLNLSSSSSSPYPAGALATLSPSSDDADATHASEHNSLVLPNHPGAAKKRQKRLAELEARRRKQQRESEKMRGVKEKVALSEEEQRRRAEHDAPFFMPMPLVPIYGPVGYPVPVGGCCSFSGNFASGSDAGGSGACASSSGACHVPPL
ncbi:hypothetical protein JCM10213v2_006769 [Rhodosporidiobolus nylandii]